MALINQLTADIYAQWEVRNTVFRMLFVEDDFSMASRSNSRPSRDIQNYRRSLTSQSDVQEAEDEQTKVRNLHERFMKSGML